MRLPSHVRRPGWMVLAGVLCLLVGAILKLPEAIESPGSDTGMFAAYGTLVLKGARPYVDFWDNHGPLIYIYWAAVQAMTGADWLRLCVSVNGLVPQSCTGLAAHVLDLGLSIATALAAGVVARRAGGSAGTAILAALLVVAFADQVLLSQEGSNPSKLTLLPSTLAVAAYLGSEASERPWRGSLVSGFAVGVAILAKQPALLTLIALLAHAIQQRDRVRVGGLLIGSAAAVGLACAVLAATGSLAGFVDQAWVYNVERVLVGYYQNPAKVPTITVERALREAAGILAVLALAGGLVLSLRPRGAPHRLLVSWAVLNLLAVLALREFVYAVPSLAVLGAFGLEQVWRRIGAWFASRRVVAHSLVLVVLALSVLPTTSFQRVQLARARGERGPGGGLSTSEELGRLLRTSFPAGPLFVYGNAGQLYPLSGRPPATRYLNAEAWRTTAPRVDQTRADLVETLRRNPPPVVVLAPHSDELELDLATYPAMRALLGYCYVRHSTTGQLDRDWTVLERTSACAPQSD